MYYYELDNKTGKRAGIVAGIAYLVLWVVLLLVISFSFDEKQAGQGILINFGDVEAASGNADPRNNAAALRRTRQQRQSAVLNAPEEIATQDHEDAPEVAQVTRQQPRQPSEVAQPGETQPTETAPVEQPREADPRLSFPGRTDGSTSPSEGSAEGAGNQGTPEGAPEGSHEGTGIGADENSFDLAGRSVMGALPKPDYNVNAAGKVVVEITVDASGVVKDARYRPVGSTTNNTQLINAALKAARSSRFNKIEGDRLQVGTITYVFHLKYRDV